MLGINMMSSFKVYGENEQHHLEEILVKLQK